MELCTEQSAVEVALRPLSPEDEPLVRRAFRRLSAQTRQLRWGLPLVDPDVVLDWVARLEDGRHFAVVAYLISDGQPLGVGRWVIADDGAEVALTVVDDWQGHGVGPLLLQALMREASVRGISIMRAWVSVENQRALHLLDHLTARRICHRGTGMLEYEIPVMRAADV
jgi:GNAT superfamily N-acetyltransferase